MYVGSHLIRLWTKAQPALARSSGEVELYAANKEVTEAMGLKPLAKDFSEKLHVELFVDASATVGIINRFGHGKLKHVEAEDLWLQGLLKEKKVSLQKIPRSHNGVDMMTKSLTSKEAERQCR